MRERIREWKSKRRQFLELLYHEVDARTKLTASGSTIGKKLGLDYEQTDEVILFLKEEGFVKTCKTSTYLDKLNSKMENLTDKKFDLNYRIKTYYELDKHSRHLKKGEMENAKNELHLLNVKIEKLETKRQQEENRLRTSNEISLTHEGIKEVEAIIK
jgi:hypothetical protein